MVDWTVLIHSGLELPQELQQELQLVLPHLDHRDARGVVCVLSHRCWQDGSIHYSYCQASLVFSYLRFTSARFMTC